MARSFPSGLAFILGSEPDHADRFNVHLNSVRKKMKRSRRKRLMEKAEKNKSQMQILEETEMDYSEKWGVDVEEAVKLALIDLKLSRDEVEVTVLEEPSKGFLALVRNWQK